MWGLWRKWDLIGLNKEFVRQIKCLGDLNETYKLKLTNYHCTNCHTQVLNLVLNNTLETYS